MQQVWWSHVYVAFCIKMERLHTRTQMWWMDPPFHMFSSKSTYYIMQSSASYYELGFKWNAGFVSGVTVDNCLINVCSTLQSQCQAGEVTNHAGSGDRLMCKGICFFNLPSIHCCQSTLWGLFCWESISGIWSYTWALASYASSDSFCALIHFILCCNEVEAWFVNSDLKWFLICYWISISFIFVQRNIAWLTKNCVLILWTF